ncbi:hypothetical protein F4804DRAFT_300097 [Jackrogersella minutella]|nr:hypothetical protein F4804DRAFT_300097 [Jackrogersella minutella]
MSLPRRLWILRYVRLLSDEEFASFSVLFLFPRLIISAQVHFKVNNLHKWIVGIFICNIWMRYGCGLFKRRTLYRY